MKIVAIAPTRPTSGASIYSSKLFRKLPADIIASEHNLLWILKRALVKETDLYHIQFEYRSFGGFAGSLLSLVSLSATLSLRRPVVVTIHGIVTPESIRDKRFKRLVALAYLIGYKLTSHFSKRIIVHSASMRSVLASRYGIESASVIPHGTDHAIADVLDRSACSNIVFWGFVRPGKGIENLILSLVLVPNQMMTVTVAGGLARKDENYYLKNLERIVASRSLNGRVKFLNRFVPDEEKGRFLLDAFALILPYTDKFIEVSGVVHDLAGCGVPLVCTDTPRFSELTDGYDCLKVESTPEAISTAIVRLARERGLGARLAKNLIQMTISESWDRAAQQHLELYHSIVPSHQEMGISGLSKPFESKHSDQVK